MSELDVVLSKINIIKNCLMAIEKATLRETDEEFRISLYEINLQRAIQACIDLANIVLSRDGLGLPNSYRQSFEILNKHRVIPSELTGKMISMVGFRNISVHDYQEINPEIVRQIVKSYLADFESFYTLIFEHAKTWT